MPRQAAVGRIVNRPAESHASAWGFSRLHERVINRKNQQIPRLPPCGIARDDSDGDEMNSIEDVLAVDSSHKTPVIPNPRRVG